MKTPLRPRPRGWVAVGLTAFVFSLALVLAVADGARANPERWAADWPDTDFSKASVPFDEILSGGPPKDGIPAIDDPRFVAVAEAGNLAPAEPVIGLEIAGDARAYPLRVLTWHEIVNDTVGGTPVAVTYCPLCNAAIVFDRRVDGEATTFGTTGLLRHSDLVMYDRATESWWQQFLGEAIVGAHTGKRLELLPSRLESWENFAARFPDGKVLVPGDPGLRPYGANPYVGYDSAARPFLYDGSLPQGIAPLARVVAIGDEAWSLELLRREGRVESGDLVLTWTPGQASALDSRTIAGGREVGNVVVQRRGARGLVDVPYDVTFAFVFHAFRPEGVIRQ
ncbi:DUF3179 domain-containing protein [Pelagibius marinus]|uniref:DUF3179 domain-containing protein n=1 Tax=Pelagibius marinus TaxID=2762760 RepID=UPI001872F0E7|nr:DUF3179 domain-containing protein [Pelagibius marinus]